MTEIKKAKIWRITRYGNTCAVMDTDRPHPWQSTWKPRFNRNVNKKIPFPFELARNYDCKFARYNTQMSDANYGDNILRDLLRNKDKHDFPKELSLYFWKKYVFSNHRANHVGLWYCSNVADVLVTYNSCIQLKLNLKLNNYIQKFLTAFRTQNGRYLGTLTKDDIINKWNSKRLSPLHPPISMPYTYFNIE